MESTHVDYKEKLPYLEMQLWSKKKIKDLYIEILEAAKLLLELAEISRATTESEIAELERQITERERGQQK